MDVECHKLNELDSGHPGFPPKILLVLGSHGRDAIVEIHDNMDKRIDSGKEGTVTTWHNFDAKPGGQRNSKMMEDMKECDLRIFLSHDKHESVTEFNKFDEPEQVGSPDNPGHINTVPRGDRGTRK